MPHGEVALKARVIPLYGGVVRKSPHGQYPQVPHMILGYWENMLTWISCKEHIDNHCGCPYEETCTGAWTTWS
ncbi:hypothetical protein OsJ_20374 [Oryza sativa Japonica Group]|uniref:Uncharacterized protein n=1 Tax=Oryza sativa subsp. japonica TaxID=39947 RepID=A3B925_ORYSJ|nr:hypothetical protein OsJ_20374 [Oryza sativa Japonica Group]